MWNAAKSRLSIAKRISLISAFFLAPIGLLTYLFIHQSMGDISFANKEIAGTRYLEQLWPSFAKPAQASDAPALDPAVNAAFDAEFDTASASHDFAQAKDAMARLNAGKTLIGAVADGSNLTLDPDLDSFYAMDAATVRLPGIVVAAASLIEAAKEAKSDARLVKIAFAVDRLQMSSNDADASLSSAMKNNAAGDTSRVLSEPTQALKAAVAKLMDQGNLLLQGQSPAALAPAEAAVLAQTDAVWGVANKELARLLQARVDSLTRNMLTQLGMVGGTLLVTLFLLTRVARSITRPIDSITRSMRQLAQGHYDVAVPDLDRKDEIGEMARSVAVFKNNALERVKLEQEATTQRAAAEVERDRGVGERAKTAEAQAEAARRLGEGLKSLASGDLTIRLGEGMGESYAQIRNDFNDAIDKLKETMASVVSSADTIQSGAREISSASDDLSRRTEQQAASLEETAAALDEITATVKKSAEGASHAREVVAAADEDAKKSALVVRQAVEAMDAIAKSAQQISQIIGVIDEIAFQTNLLALNAGVEAARAGDAGRGFAVVASEVRALAQRSAEAAKEIKGLISASTTQVDHGVKLVAETGKSLERIMTQVAEINGVVAEIAAGAKEQATGLDEVNTAINQMDQVTQQNAAMVEQSTAAGHTLSQEAAQLAGLISRFQVGRDAGDGAMRRELQKVAPHAFRPSAKAAGAPPRIDLRKAPPRRAAQPAVVNGAAAREEAGWEEF